MKARKRKIGLCFLAAGCLLAAVFGGRERETAAGGQKDTDQAAKSTAQQEKGISICQYGDATGSQAMFYTMESGDTFVVIDGGWEGNADQVREVIDSHGSQVDAWILTHPHPDHIGAFNAIWKDLKNIQVDTVYATAIDAEVYRKYAKEWDGYEVFEDFQAMAADMDNLVYLEKGQSIDIGPIHLDICNSYFDGLEDYSKDICNSSSLAFKVSGEMQSMFFCGDIYGKTMCNLVIEEYKDILTDCTYLQMGHHGNNSCTRKFMKLVNPKAAFFDAPQWLVEGEDYDTRKNMEYLEGRGVEIYSYMTLPNQINLQ